MVVKIKDYENKEITEWMWASDNKLIPKPFFTSSFFVDGLLIDCGAPACVDEFERFISPLIKKYNIKCIITHSHEDHCGAAYLLQNSYDIPIYAHKKAIPLLEEEGTYPQYRQMVWGEKRLPVDAKEVPDSIISNSEAYKFNIISTPGHAPDQFTLIEKEQEWAFVADAVQPKYRMLFGKASDIQEDIAEIYNSIKTIYEYTEGMNNLKIFTSGRGIFNGREYLQNKLSEIESLHLKVHKVYKELSGKYQKDTRLMKNVLRKTLGRESAVGKLSRGDLSKMNLVKSLLQWPL
ncbi:MAG: MBL fold metallo-hydrolase [Promethearchaeota archaeon]|nr:MAG: MBL fold metallo-hydrolase [Candidatus Lokiarchaeota archaeon]